MVTCCCFHPPTLELFDLFSFRRQDCFIYFATIQLNSSLITSINGRCYADARSIKQVQFKWRISQIFFFFGKGLFYFPRTTWQIARSILFAHVYEVTFLGEKTARYGAKAYHHHWNHMPLPKQQSYKRNHVPNPSKTVSKIHDILTLGCTSINDKTRSLKIGTLAENNRKKIRTA